MSTQAERAEALPGEEIAHYFEALASYPEWHDLEKMLRDLEERAITHLIMHAHTMTFEQVLGVLGELRAYRAIAGEPKASYVQQARRRANAALQRPRRPGDPD